MRIFELLNSVTVVMDDEFRSLLLEIKPLYQTLENPQEKSKVGGLIKDLTDLSCSEFQRNELAKALLFKLRTNQLSKVTSKELFEVKNKIARAKSHNSSTPNPATYTDLSAFGNQSGCTARKPSHKLNVHSQIRLRPPKTKTTKWKKVMRKKHEQNGLDITHLTSGTDPHDESTVEESDITVYSDEHTDSTTSSELDVKNFKMSLNDVNIKNNICRCESLKKERMKRKNMSALKRQSPHSLLNGCSEKDATLPSDGIRHVISRLQNHELQQKAQMTEAKFYDQLVEVRRENELELAKVVTRKNAELTAAQQAAEAKHQELRQAVDRLEEQLAAAVSNAEQIRCQSEEQTKELQSTMARQLEDMAQQSAERHEQLIIEHEKELKRLRAVHEQECQNLTKQIKRTSEVQSELDEKIRHCNQLESLNHEMFEAKNKAIEQQELAEKQLNKQAEHIQHIQTELQTAMARLKELEEQHAQTLKDHSETVTRLRTDCANQLARSALEYADKISQLHANIEHARSEFTDRLKEAEERHSSMLSTKEKFAMEEGRKQATEESRLEICRLKNRLEEMEQSQETMRKDYQLELDKARNRYADAEVLLEQKELAFSVTTDQLQKRICLLETKYSAQSKTVDTQTTEPYQSEMFIERVSQGVATQMVRWQEQSVEKLLEKVMEEEHARLKCAFEEKQRQLTEKHMRESAQLNADHAAQYGDLKRREELARHRLAELEFELGEAKRHLTKECDVRRQQLTEISVAREKERQEWFLAQERKLNELEQCHQETIQQLRQEHADEIQKIVEGRLGEIEKMYKEQLKQLHMKVNDSHKRITQLDCELKATCLEKDQIRDTLTGAHQTEMAQLRENHQQAIWTLKEKMARERSRARLAEAALKQREIIWTELSARFQEMQKQQQNTVLMPAEVENHLQATIESLRVQVNLLQKRIALLTENDYKPQLDSTCLVLNHDKSRTELQAMERQDNLLHFNVQIQPNGDDPAKQDLCSSVEPYLSEDKVTQNLQQETERKHKYTPKSLRTSENLRRQSFEEMRGSLIRMASSKNEP
ncbi:hypothetical protein EG68_02035 [Paragonimus skrjabini miyazakii]|uniref:Uncharacterized protein n=1 Tax=Paragonimus skrjabini miyazakii TaxID=59628 RepID=A0A8S9Z4B9_9TREM|nr:hypothetical protein EG68_02035 [Paragonimus skrjabini miyazakii]